MTLYWFLLVVSSLAIASVPAESVELSRCVGASSMLVMGWMLLIHVVSRMVHRAVLAGLDPTVAARTLERQLDGLRWLGLLVAGVCGAGFGLAAAVKTWPVFESSMTLQASALLTPGLLITASVWLSEHGYGVAMGYTRRRGWRACRDLLRELIASGGWILAPVLVMLLATDAVRWAGLFDEQSSAAVTAVLAMIAVPLTVPLIVRRIWKTRTVDPVHRDWTARLLASAGMKRLPMRVWDTQMRSYNAVVAGFVPGLRWMVVTDRLFSEMSPRDLSMVMLHEVAHVRRGHVWLRMLAMIPSWLVAAILTQSFAASPLVAVVTNLIAIAATLLTLRWVAHATERDADRVACRMSMSLPSELDPPRTEQEAAHRYCQSLRWVTRRDPSPGKASWLHPSVDDRCARLQSWAEAHATPLPQLAGS